MNRSSLLCLPLLSLMTHHFSASAQPGVLPSEDAVWIYHAFDPWTMDFRIAYCLEPSASDTLINDTLFMKLMECDPWSGLPSVYHGGLFDDQNGKVYYIHHGHDHAHLLYDFTVLPGDSVVVAAGGSAPYTLYVATVDTISIAGSDRKRIGVQSQAAIQGNQGVVHWWIQGVGGTNGLMETTGNLTLDVTSGLECMSANDTVWWAWGPAGEPGSCMSVGFEEERDLRQFEVSPNPSSGLFEFDNWRSRSFTVMNSHGMVVLTDRSSTINLSGHPPGLYFALIETPRGPHSLRLVVAR